MTDSTTRRSRIFISYRREDTEYPVGRLVEDLRRHFPSDQIFQDFTSIDPGADFVGAVRQGLDTCAAVLVVIGPAWLTATDRKGRRRLDRPDDWVVHEIAESLGHPEVRVFPVLLEAEMPTEDDLPESIRGLTRRQAFDLTGQHWSDDVARLIEFLKRVPGLAAPGATTTRMGASAWLRWSAGTAVAVALIAVVGLSLLAKGRSQAPTGPTSGVSVPGATPLPTPGPVLSPKPLRAALISSASTAPIVISTPTPPNRDPSPPFSPSPTSPATPSPRPLPQASPSVTPAASPIAAPATPTPTATIWWKLGTPTPSPSPSPKPIPPTRPTVQIEREEILSVSTKGEVTVVLKPPDPKEGIFKITFTYWPNGPGQLVLKVGSPSGWHEPWWFDVFVDGKHLMPIRANHDFASVIGVHNESSTERTVEVNGPTATLRVVAQKPDP